MAISFETRFVDISIKKLAHHTRRASSNLEDETMAFPKRTNGRADSSRRYTFPWFIFAFDPRLPPSLDASSAQ